MKEGRNRLIVFIVTVLCFLGALRNGFVWDDWRLVAGTFGFRALHLRNLRWMFTTQYFGNYCPLAWLSYALDYAVWKTDARGYHLTNLLLHAANAVLFYALAARLLRLAFKTAERRQTELGGAVAALIFALHPLRAESVIWASERRDVLAGLFFLGATLSYIKAVSNGTAAAPKGRRLAPTVGLFALAALSKATVAPLPLALLALDIFPLQRLTLTTPRKQAVGLLIEKIPYAVLSAAISLLTINAQRSVGNLTSLERHGLSSRAAQALYGLGFYLSKTVWPIRLCALYPLPNHLSLLDFRVAGSAGILLLVLGALRIARVPLQAIAALTWYYAAMLLPVLGFFQNGAQAVALRYSYLSCLGWAVLSGGGAVWSARAWRTRPRQAAAVGGALLLGLISSVVVTQKEIRVWHDDTSLWENQLRLYPESLNGSINLAAARLKAGDFEGAEARARQALRIDPESSEAQCTLAQSLEERGRLEEAIVILKKVLQGREPIAQAHGLMAWTLIKAGKPEAALPELRVAAALEPGSAQLQEVLGTMLAARKQLAEALPFLQAAVRIEPENLAYRQTLLEADEALRPSGAPGAGSSNIDPSRRYRSRID